MRASSFDGCFVKHGWNRDLFGPSSSETHFPNNLSSVSVLKPVTLKKLRKIGSLVDLGHLVFSLTIVIVASYVIFMFA